MRNIFKYHLESDLTVISLPSDARVLCAKCVDRNIYIWVEFDESGYMQRIVDRPFRVFPTGLRTMNNQARKYIDTVIMGAFVWHVYEECNK